MSAKSRPFHEAAQLFPDIVSDCSVPSFLTFANIEK